MIVVKCNKNEFAYDIHSLVKAFYPAEEVKVFEEGEKLLSSDENLPEFFILFENQGIKITILADGEKKVEQAVSLPENLSRADCKNA